VVAEFLAWQVSEPLLYRNDLICRAILQMLSLWDKTPYDSIHVLDHSFVTRTIWMRVVDAKIMTFLKFWKPRKRRPVIRRNRLKKFFERAAKLFLNGSQHIHDRTALFVLHLAQTGKPAFALCNMGRDPVERAQRTKQSSTRYAGG